jgi:hypothetical protein
MVIIGTTSYKMNKHDDEDCCMSDGKKIFYLIVSEEYEERTIKKTLKLKNDEHPSLF